MAADASIDAVFRALSTHFYARKVVRDLLWTVTSPHLIDAALFPVLTVGFGLGASDTAAATLGEWLNGLQADPTHLCDFLQAKTKCQANQLALGTYFASLLEYWLRFCPLLHVTKFDLGKQIISASQQTLGQLKFLFRVLRCGRGGDDGLTNGDDYDDFHVESSVKFFLLHPLDDQFRHHDVEANSTHSTYPLEQFVGPHLGENLAWRVQEVARKLDMCRGASVQSWLRDHYSDRVASKIVLKGYLFYPLRQFQSTSEVSRGHDWRLHRNPTDDGTRQPRHNAQVGVDHLRGWWASDLEIEFVPRVRANDTERVGGSRFVVLPKLHWLSPLIATKKPRDGTVVVDGEDNLNISSVSSMSLEELVAFARAHFASLAHSAKTQEQGGLVMPLLIAEIVRCQPGEVEYDADVSRWKELSRGFLLDPNGWDPLPLCQDAVRYKRTSDDDQVAHGREYEGRREWVNNGVIKPSDQEAELARQKKLHSFQNVEDMTPDEMSDELVAIVTNAHKTYTHSNLKQSVQAVLAQRTSSDEFGGAVGFILESLRYLLLQRIVDGDESKAVQRVAHLLLDAFDGRSNHTVNVATVAGFTVLFQDIALDETRWNYLNVSLRAIDMIRPRMSDSAAASAVRGNQVFATVLQQLLDQRTPRWNAVAVEIVRVIFSTASDEISTSVRHATLNALLLERDWKTAEQLVSACCHSDVSLLVTLFERFSALNMTKPMKRLRKLFSLLQGKLDLQEFIDTEGITGLGRSVGVQHALGPPLDAQTNRACFAKQIAPLEWTVVDTQERIDEIQVKLCNLMSARHQHPIIIGLDCEWRPQFVIKQSVSQIGGAGDEYLPGQPVGEHEGVSVYQLAVDDRVYVVDVQALGVRAMAPLATIWSAPRGVFMLVGFCVSGDLRRLNHSFPTLLISATSERKLLVELKQMALYRQLPASSWGLSQLYEACFDQQVDKEEQCSDWGQRPLSDKQLEYAARDAYAVRNIAYHLLADVASVEDDVIGYVERFAVITTVNAPRGLGTDAELGHWIMTLDPLNESHVRAALVGVGLRSIAQSLFSVDKTAWEEQARLPQGLVVKTIAIVLKNGGRVPSVSHDLIHYAAVVLHVDLSIEMAALAAHFHVQPDDLQLADRETLLRVFGYPRGSIGPLGLREQNAVHVVMDAPLLQETALLPGAGREDLTYAIDPRVLQETVGASVAALTCELF